MNIYSRKQRWKWFLAGFALLIVIVSLWYSNNLVNKIKRDEREKVKLWAQAVQKKAKLVKFTNVLFEKIKSEERKKAQLYAEATEQITKTNADYDFILKVLQDNTTVPVILTDENLSIKAHRNLDSLKALDSNYLKLELSTMQLQNPPVEIDYYKGRKNYLYYKNSQVFNDIKIVFDSLIKSFITEVAVNSAAVPIIYTNEKQDAIVAIGNIDEQEVNSPEKLKLKLKALSSENTPIDVDLGENSKGSIFYSQSILLTQLTYYPYVQFGVIGLFLLIAYVLFSTARKAEQDQVWVGMSKETAHQLGTPLSSLMAWNEHLRGIGVEDNIVDEMQRDVKRLNTITDRFSKIGSQPTLHDEDVIAVLKTSIDYLRSRTSKNVNYDVHLPEHELHAQLSVPLFDWVIENICKNAVDAMNGKGTITIQIHEFPEGLHIDISDTGKGIPKHKFKTVFEPGYTSKQRGWGLGLSLCKRIIENYHNGKISVLKSEENKGTTFRITLNR